LIARLLIANRGEIARRIICACRERGIESVAVYSTADARAAHVAEADRAVELGPAPAVDSYLSISKVIDAARASGADAVHPGYGFLAQNSEFADACARAGLIFVGPTADALAKMGSKISARATVMAAGIPVIPGETPADQTPDAIAAAAQRVGYPVLVKASAGGGGKGMRIVASARELPEAVASARREATAAFGDGTLYVEHLLTTPRHVEVQVLADAYGNIVHLFERDCSLQRRHQKIVEESPSPAVTPALRDRMTAAAVAVAASVGYRSAGTVEFLVAGSGDEATFYFLEMNTRLQVEHPVTEAVTGVDLVGAQLTIASGGVLPWRQAALSQRGHAVECRIYAEGPARDFLPQAGHLALYREPRWPGVRIDSGVREGDDITVHYDPLMAKVIASGETRDAAIARAEACLRAFPILGVQTNIAFLRRVLAHETFLAGTMDTGFLDREIAALTAVVDDPIPDVVLAAASVHAAARSSGKTPAADQDPWARLENWRGGHP
jgi:acetyl-CoA carboxylase biotin carboxylase subunit